MSKRASSLGLLILILIAAFALRLHSLADQSLWFDETATGVSLRDARLNPQLVEAHSVIYFLMVAPSYAVLPIDFGLRWPSIVAGMLSICVMYRLGKRISGERAGLIAAALFAISPYFIHYSREVRHYALVALLTLVTLWLALRLKPHRRWASILFVMTAVLLAGLHVLTVFWLAPLLAMLALRRMCGGQGAQWGTVIGAGVGIMLIVAAIRSMGMAGRGYLEGLEWIESLSMIQLPKKFLTQGLGIEWLSPLGKRVAAGVITAALIGSALLTRRILPVVDRSVLTLLIVLSLLPIALIIAASYVAMPLWVLRYLTPSLAVFILLVALILATLRPSVMAAAGVCAVIVSGMLSYIVHPEQHPEDWRSVKAYLEVNLHDDDIVFTCGSLSAVPLAYYLPNLPTYYLTNKPGIPDIDSSEVLLTQTHPPPNAIPNEARRVWIVNRNGRICTLAEYGIDATVLNEAAEAVTFTGVTLMRYSRSDQP